MRRIKRILSIILILCMVLAPVVSDMGGVMAAETNGAVNVSLNTEETDESETESVTESDSEDESLTDESATDETLTEETTTEELTTEETTTEETTQAEDIPLLSKNAKFATGADAKVAHNKLFKIASEALTKICESKDIYALIYLTDSYDVKSAPSDDADTVASLESAHTVRIIGMDADLESVTEDDYLNKNYPEIWYKIVFYDGDEEKTGYAKRHFLAYSDELLIGWEEEYAVLFFRNGSEMDNVCGDEDIREFPSEYQTYLKSMRDSHPKWKFVAMKTNVSLNDAVENEYGDKSWISASSKYAERGTQSGWAIASKEGIKYYMDPLNWLDDEHIFMFEQLTFNDSYHSESAVASMLSSTFMSGKIPGDTRTYAYAFYNIGKEKRLSPAHLASRVLQEQGNGTSPLISGDGYGGKYPQYRGYYNYFNIGASGSSNDEVIRNGLKKAYDNDWNTRYASLEGGASSIGTGYVLKGQDTIYLEKFNVNPEAVNAMYSHQYMQNIQAPSTEALSVRKIYNGAGALNSQFVFKIPVYVGNTYNLNMTSATLKKGSSATLVLYKNGSPMKLNSSGVTVKLNHSNQKYAGKSVTKVVEKTGSITAITSGKTEIKVSVIDSDTKKTIELKCIVTVLSPIIKAVSDVDEKNEIKLYTSDTPSATSKKVGDIKYKKTQTININYITSNDEKEGSYPYDTTDSYEVVWSIKDKNVATFTHKEYNSSARTGTTAVITAKEGGWTTITATAKVKASKFAAAREYKKEYKIYVCKPLDSVGITPKNVSLKAGEKEKIRINYDPIDTTDSLTLSWESDDDSVAVVENDFVIAKGEGTCVLTAMVGPLYRDSACKTYEYFVCKCNVTVSNYTAQFLEPDGTKYTSGNIVYGSRLGDIEFEKDPWTKADKASGEKFIGWYTEKDGKGDRVTKDYIPSGDVKAYAYYKAVAADALYVQPMGSYGYTGRRIYPDVKVFCGDEELVRGVDYTLSYMNNINAADRLDDDAPTVFVKGKGTKYSGMDTQATFTISPKDLSDADIVTEDYIVKYNGKEHKIVPVVKWGDVVLKNRRDYVYSYPDSDYIEQGTYQILIEAADNSNYVGETCAYIYISKNTFVDDLSISYGNSSTGFNSNHKETYTGKPIILSKINVADGSKNLVYGTEVVDKAIYDVYKLQPEVYGDKLDKICVVYQYMNNTEIGTADIVLTGVNRYIGTITMHFKIAGTSMSQVAVSGIKSNCTYTGTNIRQTNYKLTYNKTTLKEGKDYTVAYSDNVKVGVAKITFIGKGKYSGYTTRNFIILPDLSGGMGSMGSVGDSESNETSDTGVTNAKTSTVKDVTTTVSKKETQITDVHDKKNEKPSENGDSKEANNNEVQATQYYNVTGREVTGATLVAVEDLK